MNSLLLSSDFRVAASLPPFGRYTIEPGVKSGAKSAARTSRTHQRDESREQRIQRHLAWCELLQRERLATAADLGTPPRLREPLRFVAPARGQAAAQRRTRRHESVFFATVLASLFFTFASASLSEPAVDATALAAAPQTQAEHTVQR